MDNKKEIIKRLNYISGQVQGIKKMVEDDRDCLAILQQMKAAKSGVESAMGLFAYGEICHQKTIDDDKVKKLVKTIVQS